MSDYEKMKSEMDRVRDFLSETIKSVECDDGDIRFFAASLLTAAIQLHVEIEGTASLDRVIAKIAAREMIRSGGAGRC